MIKTEKRDINGLQVTTVQIPAMKAYAVFARLGAVLGPALAKLGDVKIANLEDEVEKLGPAAGALLSGLAGDTDLVLALLQSTSVVKPGEDGKLENTDLIGGETAINKIYTGDFLALLLSMKFAIEVNFADFLAAGVAALPAKKAAAKDPTPE